MYAKTRAGSFLFLLAAMLLTAFPTRAQGVPEGSADWRPTLEIYTKMADDANARLNDQRELFLKAVERFRKDFALIENMRQQVVLFEITAEDPWEFRDALRGIRQLRAKINAISKAPFAIKDRVEAALKRLHGIEADILAQNARADVSEEFVKGLEDFRKKIDVLRDNAASLDRELTEAISPAALMLKTLEREEDSIRTRMNEIWKDYYSARHPSIFEMTGQDNILLQWDTWKAGYAYLLEFIDKPGSEEDFPRDLAACAAAAVLSMAFFAAAIAWIRKKGFLRTSPTGLYHAALLLSISIGLGYMAELTPFQYYTFFSASQEILLAAALSTLALFLKRQNASPASVTGESDLWPLWRLLFLGFVIQALNFPYFMTEAVYAPALILTGASFARRSGRIDPKRRLDLALSRILAAASFALALCALAGAPQISILLTSTLFYVLLSVRFSLSLFRILTRFDAGEAPSGPRLLLAVFSGVGLPLTFITLLIFFLWLVSLQFGGEGVFIEYFSREFRYESFAISLGRLLVIIAGFYVAKILVALSRNLILDMRERSPAMDKGAAASLTAIAKYFWWGVYLLCVLFFLGFSPTSLAVVAGGLSVGIGFGLQNIVNNFISGLILLFGRSVQAGDVIEVGGILGVVKEVNIRNTEVRSFDNATLFTPNSDLISNQITNWSHRDPSVRREIDVGVAYGSDLDLVRALLVQAALESPYVLRDPRPLPLFWNFGSSSLDFKLRLWVDSIMNVAGTLSDVRDAVDRLFRENDVEIPFPQTDVHMKQAPPAAQQDEDVLMAGEDGGDATPAKRSPDDALP